MTFYRFNHEDCRVERVTEGKGEPLDHHETVAAYRIFSTYMLTHAELRPRLHKCEPLSGGDD